jgi:hypothetical protein
MANINSEIAMWESSLVVCERFRQEFQRYRATEPRVFGPVHDTHAALAELRKRTTPMLYP